RYGKLSDDSMVQPHTLTRRTLRGLDNLQYSRAGSHHEGEGRRNVERHTHHGDEVTTLLIQPHRAAYQRLDAGEFLGSPRHHDGRSLTTLGSEGPVVHETRNGQACDL